MRRLLTIIMLLASVLTASAQRTTDSIDRGLVAVPAATSGNYVTWRRFGEEYYDVTYNLYRDGTKIASGLNVMNYTDKGGTASSLYAVSAVVRGVEQEQCKAVKRWNNQYFDIKVKDVTDRNGANVTSHYTLNDVTVADVDGDGIVEFMVKRPCDIAADPANNSAFNRYDCYKMDGTLLWWIDMGPNMISGADEQWDIIAYDWDMDGRAEILFRGADNMRIHHKDGTITQIGSTADTRWSGMEYTSSGNEYLIYADGETAVPYVNIAYPLARGNDSDWGSGIVGHRSTKHFFGAPFLDGRKASIFIARGIYTKHAMVAYDVDSNTHKLTQRWRWDNNASGVWWGQGYHNYAIADVDWDGRDEIVYGSMVIDDNGKGLSTTGLGHGDAQHCSDLDPYRHGQEQFACNENAPNMNYRNATTSKIYYRSVGSNDDGRALCGNFTNSYPGSVGRSTGTGMVSSVADKVISELGDFIAWSDLNNRIYWDGDLCDEVLNSPGTEREAAVIKPGTGRLFTSSGCKMNNWSKNNPGAQADILGDWREELVLRTDDNKYLRIYISNTPTSYGIYSLWHDHQYRQAMVWQPLGYNQPPHKSYFLGEMEGITMAPPPLTLTGRTEIKNGGVITNEDKHFIVCETSDSEVSVEDGAAPYITTFNVPSWVQGTASSNTTAASPKINYTYYTCNVTGGAFAGNMRLVKQGDGTLCLPAVNETYSGNTDIWAGTLNFDGQMPNSRVWLNRFAELNTSATYGKSIEMEYASVLRPGGKDQKGTTSCDSLIMQFGSHIAFDLYSDGTQSDVIKANTLVINTKNWEYGPEFLTPVFDITCHCLEGKTLLEEGNYKLMEVAEIVGDLGNILIKGISGQKASLQYEDGVICLVVEGIRDPSSIIWAGNASNIWNFASTENFLNDNGDNDIFVQGDDVTFNDDASEFNVNLTGDLPADTITVDNTKSYSFSGSGAITGNATLIKKNTGKLTISTDNTYTGGNHILGGTVSVSSLANANQAKGNLGGVTTTAAKFTIEDGGTLLTTAPVTCGSPIKLVGAEGGVINNSADFNMNKAFSGTTLTKKGAGWLKFFTSNSLSRLVITTGTVELSSCTSPASQVELQGGTLQDDGQAVNHSIHVPEGKTATWVLTNTYYTAYANKLTGAGTLKITPRNTVSRVRITGNWSAFTGTIEPTTADIWLPLDNSNGLPKGTLNIPAGVTVTNTAKTFKIGTLTGSGNLAHPIANFQNQSGISGSNTWQVGNDSASFTFKGKITDAGGSNKSNFVKAGTCKMSVTGAWDNTGTVKVNGGELHISSGCVLGTGALTVASGATLSGLTNSSGNLKNSNFTINGTVQVGSTATATTGIMQFGGKNVTFNEGSTLMVGINKTSATAKVAKTQIKNIGKLTMNGTIKIYLGTKALTNLQPGDEIQIWEAQSFTGTPKFEFPAGVNFDTSNISNGILVVTMVDGINSLVAPAAHQQHSGVFDISGRRIGHSTDKLSPGMYIINGKKQFIK